jgi:chitin synthase
MFSDDATAMAELRACMRTLGFKSKHVTSIFSLLIAILELGNLQFTEGVSREDTAHVANLMELEHAATLLGVASDELAQALTTKTSYVRRELCTILLNPERSAVQRDQLVRDLYAILFAFVVETANHKLAPSPQDPAPPAQITLLDQPGYQSRAPTGTNSMALTSHAPLIAAYGQNGYEEFVINFADELLHSYVVRNTFEDNVGYNAHVTGDGVALPAISTMDNAGCVELLRGSQLSERTHRKPGGVLGVMSKAASNFKQGKGSDARDEDMLQDMMTKFGVHASFVSSPSMGGSTDRNLFGVNHYAGNCTYDARGFVEKDADLLDSSFVTLLRRSSDPFVAKLFSGPSLATEGHHHDPSIVVQAQVSMRPLRQPTQVSSSSTMSPSLEEPNQLDSSKTYPITTQANHNLSELLAHLDKSHLWVVSCIRPNDSGSPNSFDKRRVKAQIRSLLLPDMVARRKQEFVVDYDQVEFCDRYVPTMMGETSLRIRQCAQKNGLQEGKDYVLGHRMIFLTYPGWKLVEDSVREVETDRKMSMAGDDESVMPDDAATEHTHDASLMPQLGYFGESADNLLLTRNAGGTNYLGANSGDGGYGAGGLNTPRADKVPAPYAEADAASGWSEWDKASGVKSPVVPEKTKEGGDGLVVHNAPNTVEEVPTSRTRRIWLWVVWGMTWWIPSFLLSSIGRMKRPDIRLAWREKVTICLLITFCCAFILFYIIFFGKLLCPDLNKAWDAREVSQHTGNSDFWVAIAGRVYDVSNFVHNDHSDIIGAPSNAADSLELLAGQDLTGYFPPPLSLACSGIVNDPMLFLQPKNFTPFSTQAIHTSGPLQGAQGTKLDNIDWYTQSFLPKINQFHKGPLVWTPKEIMAQAQDKDIQR